MQLLFTLLYMHTGAPLVVGAVACEHLHTMQNSDKIHIIRKNRSLVLQASCSRVVSVSLESPGCKLPPVSPFLVLVSSKSCNLQSRRHPALREGGWEYLGGIAGQGFHQPPFEISLAFLLYSHGSCIIKTGV